MKPNIRLSWQGLVYRLYQSFEQAQSDADLMNASKSLASDFEVREHESKHGFILRCRKTGQVFDVAGIVRGIILPA